MVRISQTLCTLLLFCYSVTAYSQADTTRRITRRVPALLSVGQSYLQQQQFYRAEDYFRRAIVEAPVQAAAYYYLAECKRGRMQYEEARTLYQKAQTLDNVAFPLAEFYQALMHKFTGHNALAQQQFVKFVARYSTSSDAALRAWIVRAQHEIDGIVMTQQLSSLTTAVPSFRLLPSPVNSSFHDYAAYSPTDDLIISSARPTAQKKDVDDRYGEPSSNLLFFSEQSGSWRAESNHPLAAAVNSSHPEGSGVFERDSSAFYFTACPSGDPCRIVVSYCEGDEWTSPVPLGAQINALEHNTKHPALSPGGDTLYFASDRPGGYGQLDIWMSIRKNQTWQTPTNLGKAVNTAYCEVSPTYGSNRTALIFASDRPKGMGGYDLYATVSPTRYHRAFSQVVNLGFPFNSSKDELFFHASAKRSLLTSNRGSASGSFNVYSADIREATLAPIAQRRLQEDEARYQVRQLLTSQFAPKDSLFLQQLSWDDRQAAQRYIEWQALRAAISKQIVRTDTMEFQYEQLPEREQQLVQHLVQGRAQLLVNEDMSALQPQDQRYYESLSPAEQIRITQQVNQQWFKQILQEQIDTLQIDSYFYEKLAITDQNKIDRAVQRQQTFYQRDLAHLPEPTDMFYYQSLPLQEKTALTRMARVQQFIAREAAVSSNQSLTHVYERLDPTETLLVERHISRRSFQQATTEASTFSPETKVYYEQLSTAEKESLERLATAKRKFILTGEVDAPLADDQQYYESLPTEEKEQINQVIDARMFAQVTQTASGVSDVIELILDKLPLEDQQRIDRAIASRRTFHQRSFQQLPTADDMFTYQALSVEEQETIRRTAPPRQFAHRHFTTGAAETASTVLYYEKLPRADQEKIDRIVKQRRHFILHHATTSPPPEDDVYLATLSTEEQQQVEQVIAARTFEMLLEEEPQAAQLSFRYYQLAPSEQASAQRLARSRRTFSTKHIIDLSTAVASGQRLLTINWVDQPVTVSGKLATSPQRTFSRRALPTHVYLVDAQNDTLAMSSVEPDGTFTFDNIAYQETHRVVTKRTKRTLAALALVVEDLSLSRSGNVKPKRIPSFDHLFFATNRFGLSEASKRTLDSLVQYLRRHPESTVEIIAYADSTGTSAYNLQLTQKRAQSARHYLVKSGTHAKRLTTRAMGAIPGDNLSYCRRVELVLSVVSDVSEQAVYLMKAPVLKCTTKYQP